MMFAAPISSSARDVVGGGHEVDVRRAHLFQRAEGGGESLRVRFFPRGGVGDLVILAKDAAQRAPAEKEGARTFADGDARLLIGVQPVFDDARVFSAAAGARPFFSVRPAFDGAERTMCSHEKILPYFGHESKAIAQSIDFSGEKIYNYRT